MKDFNFNLLAIEGVSKPMVDASIILRNLVERLVEQLFSQKSPADRRPPALTTLLSPQEARALTEVHLWKLKGTRSTVQVPKKRNARLKTVLKDLVSKAVSGEVKPREWQTTFHDRLVWALGGGTQGSGLPHVLYPVVEKAAWSDLRFQRSMALRVYDYLRERVLFIPGERLDPGFSPRAFQALIGLAEPGESPGQKMFLRMVEEIREEAREHVLVEGWAGFWDQWLICVARQKWPLAFEREKSRFCRSLLALPLFSKRSTPSPQQRLYVPKRSIPDRFKKWLPSFFGRIRVRPLLKGKKPGFPDLAYPDWEEQVPEFLKGKEVTTDV